MRASQQPLTGDGSVSLPPPIANSELLTRRRFLQKMSAEGCRPQADVFRSGDFACRSPSLSFWRGRESSRSFQRLSLWFLLLRPDAWSTASMGPARTVIADVTLSEFSYLVVGLLYEAPSRPGIQPYKFKRRFNSRSAIGYRGGITNPFSDAAPSAKPA